jgi:nitrite reductase/ring-hydroxylating ferredoxin subunit
MSLQGWYPLTLSRDVPAGSSAGTRVLGQEFVVWRDTKGAPHVWEDRCPHRGMKLSFGFVRGDHIACLYHGWQYDAAGQCQYIPAHPDLQVPKSIRVPRFAIAEVAGIVWGCFDGEESKARPADLPAGTTPLRSIFADSPAPLLVERIARTPFGADAPMVTPKAERIVEIRLGDTALIAGVQPVSENETALHLIVAGTLDGAGLTPLALWAEQLRRDVETATQPRAYAEAAA